jgi:hypothetical protein
MPVLRGSEQKWTRQRFWSLEMFCFFMWVKIHWGVYLGFVVSYTSYKERKWALPSPTPFFFGHLTYEKFLLLLKLYKISCWNSSASSTHLSPYFSILRIYSWQHIEYSTKLQFGFFCLFVLRLQTITVLLLWKVMVGPKFWGGRRLFTVYHHVFELVLFTVYWHKFWTMIKS